MIKAVIIDDEEDAVDTIKSIINLFIDNVSIVGEGNNVKSGIEVIKKQKPDIVLIDVQMPDGTGFDLLNYFGDTLDFKVIFVTAYEQYALKAIKFHAFDYLLKPVSPEELTNSIRNITKSLADNKSDLTVNSYKENSQLPNNKKKIVLKTAQEVLLISLEDIIRLESDINYTKVFLKDGKKILVTTILKDYEEMLSDLGFFRAHKTHLVNLNHVVKFKKEDGGFIIMSDNSVIPVASRKKDELLTAMNTI